MCENTYNDWKNRETWNIALWINNDEGLYRCSVDYVATCRRAGRKPSYTGFVRYAGLTEMRTPDGVSYSGSRLDRTALTEMLEEV